MAEDLIDLFAGGPDTELLVAAGHYKGKENIQEKNHIASPTTTPRRRNTNKVLFVSGFPMLAYRY